MVNRNLKYFMRSEAKEEQILTVPGPDTIRDENGEVVNLEIKKLHNDTITEINDMYKSRTPLKDNKGNYVVQNGEVVFKSERDAGKAARHILVEALVYPNLKDPDLMKYFDCVDLTEMPLKVFPSSDEYSYVSKKVMEVLGMLESDEENDIDQAKN